MPPEALAMYRPLDSTLRSLRQGLGLRLDKLVIERACRDAGHRWRPGLLNPAALIH